MDILIELLKTTRAAGSENIMHYVRIHNIARSLRRRFQSRVKKDILLSLNTSFRNKERVQESILMCDKNNLMSRALGETISQNKNDERNKLM